MAGVIHTGRLTLTPVSQDDLDALFAINNQPEGWTHAPHERHLAPVTTKAWIERAAEKWHSDGLSYWTVRLRDNGKVIGVGGVQRKSDRTWNLFYRLDKDAYGRGYATELGRAAIDAAHRDDADQPVIAWILAHHAASQKVAERLGLVNYGPRRDPSDGVERLAYADRPLPPEMPPQMPPEKAATRG